MKGKNVIGALAFILISASALGAPRDDFFFPGGVWKGDLSAVCNGKGIGGQAIMDVKPLAVEEKDGVKYEYFTGSITIANVPADCVNIDFTNGVPLAIGTYTPDASVTGFASPNILVSTKNGTVTPSATNTNNFIVDISFRNGSNYVDLDGLGPPINKK